MTVGSALIGTGRAKFASALVALGAALVVLSTLTGANFEKAGAQAGQPLGFDVTQDVVDEFVAGGSWSQAVAADWMSDGRMLLLTQLGQIHVVNPSTGASSLHFTIPNLDTTNERGSLDLAIAPDFATSKEFFVYYTHSNQARLHIDKFVFGENGTTTANSRRVVWQNPGPNHSTWADYHIGGSLNFGPDGKFYLSIGEGGYGPNSRDFDTVFGKVLRINRDGTVPTDNPFYDASDASNVDEIWAYGLRNPFRATFDEVTGNLWLGDVGGHNDSTSYEEVNVVTVGKDYGWAFCEGPTTGNVGAACPSGTSGPIHSYRHTSGAGCCLNKAVVGGEVYRGSVYPFASPTYLYSDYATGDFEWITFNQSTTTKTGAGSWEPSGGLATSPNPVWLEVSPVDGYYYYIHLGIAGDGQLRRFRYISGDANAPTITAASADPIRGAEPLAVRFTGSATDPDTADLTFEWEFGDGQRSANSSPRHTYSEPGTYFAVFRVSDGTTTVSAPPISIAVGNPPTASILTPPTGTTFIAGESITLTATASDFEDGSLTGASLSWNVRFLHNDHAHPGFAGSGERFAFTVPVTGHSFAGNTRYRAILTATDSDGLSVTESIQLDPVKATVDLATSLPAQSTVMVDGITQVLPSTIDTLVGFQHVLEAPRSTCIDDTAWRFDSWSDGGARVHQINAIAGTITASYTMGGAGSCSSEPTLGTCQGKAVTLVVPLDAGKFVGTRGDDVILGTGGPDNIDGGGGDDTICGGAGRDRIDGGTGDDLIDGGRDKDTMHGGSGKDVLLGGEGRDILRGGRDSDFVFGGRNGDKIFGQHGRDILLGVDGNDRIVGGVGNDSIDGGRGRRDVLIGGFDAGGTGDRCSDRQPTTIALKCETGKIG